MYRIRIAAAFTLACLALSPSSLRADVRADEKTHVEFAGMLGRMMNIFGGKSAREGMTSTVAVKGDRKATLNDSSGQIIDLSEEKIYDPRSEEAGLQGHYLCRALVGRVGRACPP